MCCMFNITCAIINTPGPGVGQICACCMLLSLLKSIGGILEEFVKTQIISRSNKYVVCLRTVHI